MRRLLAIAALLLACPVAAQTPPPAASAGAQPAQGGSSKAIEKAKAFGKLGVEKVAPKLGKAEKIVRKQAEPVVDKAVDFAAEKTGLAPRR